ncbi:siderophore-interacting protein [Schaalia hyovaginalis]|uniref:siderophore-interacting protein n=1 Tax=Schaalia hyovaginalis TaxID=29316 RepID=UPI001F3C0817|nr:siderophore-interacting protein [Schaalia hyovaginalis]
MEHEPFRFFRVRVDGIVDLAPSIRRMVFAGGDLDAFADPGRDQRIKLLLPAAEGGFDHLPTGPDWYREYRALPERRRGAMRTYTTRAVTGPVGARRVVVDMIRHGALGPASAWCESVRVGDEAVLLGPNAFFEGEPGGVDFVPPVRTDAYLLGGDETAAPAIARILEELPAEAKGIAVVEMPTEGDLAYLPGHPGIEVRALARGSSPRGEGLVAGVECAAAELLPDGVPGEVEEIDIDSEILWEVPRTAKGGAALKSTSLYAWLAAEASSVKAMRRHLVADRGIDRRSVAFMGYWREGRSED